MTGVAAADEGGFDPSTGEVTIGPAGEPIGGPDHLQKNDEVLRKAKRGRQVVGTGLACLVIVGVLAWLIHAVSSSDDKTEISSVAKGARVNEPPGAPKLAPAQSRAYEDKNNQNREEAARTGGSSVRFPIMATDPEDMKPKPIVQEAPVRNMNVGLPNNGQPYGQPLGNNGYTPINGGAAPQVDMRAAVLAAINDTLVKSSGDRPLLHTTDRGETGSGNYTQVAGPGGKVADTKADRGETSPSQDVGELLADPHEAYAVTRIAANSDALAPVTLELLSGPLSGGLVYGKPTVNQKSMQISLDRLHWQGQDYKIEAMVIDAKTRSPALDVDVANHYGERVLLPGVAAFFGAAGKAASTPAATISSSVGATTSASSPLSAKQDMWAGVGGMGTAASAVVSKDAEAIKPTITLDANVPQMVAFLKGVYTGDRVK